jgi:hypothetical protein
MEGFWCRRKHVGTLALTALSKKEPRGVEDAHRSVACRSVAFSSAQRGLATHVGTLNACSNAQSALATHASPSMSSLHVL